MASRPAAVVYDRASTINQRDNYSRADAARLVEYAESLGYRAELRREVKSGEDLVNRPVMRQLLEDVADGRVAAIVVQHLDRLSRDQDQIDGRVIRQICRDAACVVITPDKTFDFAADADDDLADVQFLIAKFQKRAILRQTVAGMKEAARQGKRLPALIPLGYDAVYLPADRPDKPPRRDFSINATEAALIQRVFDLYETLSEDRVAKTLNAEGIRWPIKHPNRQAKYGNRTERPFRGGDIHSLVRNELYAGFVTWGKEKRSRYLRDFETARVFRPDLQIVSLEQWNRIQRIREERKQLPPRSVSSPYLLSGLLKCPHCGSAMSGHRRRDRRTVSYFCSLRNDGGRAACQGRWVAEPAAREAVVGFLVGLFTERIALERFVNSVARRYGLDRTDDELRREVEAELGLVDSQKRNLIDAVASGALRGADIAAKAAELEEQRGRLERRLASDGARGELRAEIAAAVRLLQGSGLGARIVQLPDAAFQRLCRLIFCRFTLTGTARGRGQAYEMSAYEFTPDFTDLLAHCGSHVSGSTGFTSMRRSWLGQSRSLLLLRQPRPL